MIRDMRRGHVPSVQRLRSLCEVLDLEFFVGPPRMRWDDDGGGLPDVLLRLLERMAQDSVRLTADAGRDPISSDIGSLLTAKRGAELPPADSESTPPDARSRDVNPQEAAEGGDEPPQEAHKAEVWMNKIVLKMYGLDPATCDLYKIRDGHMEPTLPNGCAILVDRTNTDWQPPRIVAVRIDDDVIARRAAFGDDGRRLLASDHPGWPVAPLPAGAEVVGEVRWVGLWLNRASPARDQGESASAVTPSQDKGNLAG